MKIGDKVVISDYGDFMYIASLRSVDTPKQVTVRVLNGDHAGTERSIRLDALLPYQEEAYEEWLTLYQQSKVLEARTRDTRQAYLKKARENSIVKDVEWLGHLYGKI